MLFPVMATVLLLRRSYTGCGPRTSELLMARDIFKKAAAFFAREGA